MKEVLSSQLQPQQSTPSTDDDNTRCHERCYCQKCLRLISMNGQHQSQACENNIGHVPLQTCENNAGHIPSANGSDVRTNNTQATTQSFSNVVENNGHVPSATCPTIPEPNGHVPSMICPAVSNPNGHIPSETSPPTTETNGHILSTSCQTAGEPNGHVPSITCPNVGDTNGHIPSHTSLPTSESYGQTTCDCQTVDEPIGDVPCQTIDTKDHVSQQRDLSVSETGEQVVSSPALTTPSRLRCHPLCCCRHCLQLVSSDSTSNNLPDVYCRNDQGLSGECHLTAR